MSLQDINFQTERIENVFIMRVQGSINSFTIKRFVDEVKACNKKYPVILDLEEVVLVSSVGIRALREVSDFSYSSGNKIILLNPSPTI
ncbi:MAG: STAS domain-containing protein, partial [Leptospira sp.]|nr:STAS domain-containing protein [Leptospira sp.]